MGSIVRTPNNWRTREVRNKICGHSETTSWDYRNGKASGLTTSLHQLCKYYRCIIQDFSRIATLLTAILKVTKSSVASTSRVDNNEIIGGGGAGVESGRSLNEKWAQSLLQRSPLYIPTLRTCYLRTWLSNSLSTLGSTIMLSNWSKLTDLLDYLSHPQMLPSFLSRSWTSFLCRL